MITKLFAQTDPSWAKQLLGGNTDSSFNIGNYGCVVTAYGNMLVAVTGNMQYTPSMINDFMKAHNGFPQGSGLFIWSAALAMGHVEAHGTTTDLATVNKWLQDPPNYAILEVRFKGNIQHFVMSPYVDKIVDSEDGLLKSMSTYAFVSAHLYRSTDAVLVPTPQPAPVAPVPKTSVTVTAKPFLNLRTGPGSNFPIGTGTDGTKNIHSLPTGATVEYVAVVPADPASPAQGLWLRSIHGNFFIASGTNYQS